MYNSASELPTRLTADEILSVRKFMDDFGSYLNEDNWSSEWGGYVTERPGPKTNNAVEKCNRMIKEQVTYRRKRRTLRGLAAYFSSTLKFTLLSQYGPSLNKGEARITHRRAAAELIFGALLCQPLHEWGIPEDHVPDYETWLFVKTPNGNDLTFPKDGSLTRHVLNEDENFILVQDMKLVWLLKGSINMASPLAMMPIS